jgi:hypothetical protein
MEWWMISSREISENAAAFGVPDAQVVRDHLISHVIFAVALMLPTAKYLAPIRMRA